MFPVLQVGPLAIQVPGLILILGLWMGLSLSERHAPRFGVNVNDLYNLVFTALIAGVVGARLVNVARYPSAFTESPLSLISLNPGLLDFPGGIVVGLIATLVYGQRKKLQFWPVLDALTPALAVLAIAISLSNLAAGNAFGAPTDLPWGIELWGARRQPTQIYTALGGVLILWAIWPGRGVIRTRRPGGLFLAFLSLSASIHLIIEAFRGDSILILNGIRLEQVEALAVLTVSLWGLGRLRDRQETTIPMERSKQAGESGSQ